MPSFSDEDIFEAHKLGFKLSRTGSIAHYPSQWHTFGRLYDFLVKEATYSMDPEALASRIILAQPLFPANDFLFVKWKLMYTALDARLINITIEELKQLADDGHVIAIKTLRELAKLKLRG